MSEEGSNAPGAMLPGLASPAVELVRAARVHVVGAGATAGPALLYLARAGVETIYVDDGGDVAPGDATAWLYPPARIGEPRLFAAVEALRGAGAAVRPYATGVDASAVLVCGGSEALARTAAERARLAGLPHVVALGNGDGGEIVSVPSGAPCLGCASRPGARLAPDPAAAAALGALAAAELLLVVGRVMPRGAGRRLALAGGWPTVEPTARRSGCDCRNVY